MSKYKNTRFKHRFTMAKKLASANGYSFSICYMELCRQQRIKPLPLICVSLPYRLEFTADRVKMDEWTPILSSLALDKVLRSIKIHSRCQNRKPLEDVTSENKARKVEKTPLLLTRYILERLSQSVAQCVRGSSNLTCLELEGIPLTSDCVAILCVGISGSKSLHHLSLCRSYIGDQGCELICQTVTTTTSIKTLNLSQCNLSSRCAKSLAAALSRQKLSLYHDTWKQSLRYRQPDFETMPGLRRLTLNGNPQLGNTAVNLIIDAVRDSLWMKALDLQNCGLTNEIASEVLDLVHRNVSLAVVDVRMNQQLDEKIVDEIIAELDKNNLEFNIKSEYKWTGLGRKKITSSMSVRGTRDKPKPTHRTVSATQRPVPAEAPAVPVPLKPVEPSLEPKGIRSKSEVGAEAKPSLHIDLQTHLISSKSDVESVVESTKLAPSEYQSDDENERTERHSLVEQLDSLDLLLQEERLRRKIAEEKLQTMKRSVQHLENCLRQKEQEMKGYVIVSQESLDDMCASFDQLLELLTQVSKQQAKNGDCQTEDKPTDIFDVDNIREQMSTLIRRTKSDGVRRRSSDRRSRNNKCVKSESNVRSSRVSIPLCLERNIGDNSDALSPSMPSSRSSTERTKLSSQVERSRAIFNNLIGGDQ